jgi:hypothetical protein
MPNIADGQDLAARLKRLSALTEQLSDSQLKNAFRAPVVQHNRLDLLSPKVGPNPCPVCRLDACRRHG